MFNWLSISRLIVNSSNRRLIRFSSSVDKNLDRNQWQIATLADGTIACWHPEKLFPFEHSRPIDSEWLERDREELSKLCEARRKGFAQLDSSGPNRTYLREIFNTGKTEFQTRTREERLYATSAPLPTRIK